MDLEEKFIKETGLSSTIPNYINSDGYYSQEYVEWLEQKLTLQCVGNWVAIESTEQPEKCTEVVLIYKYGRKAVALFDGDGRFYIEKDDWDITNIIAKWHKLP